MKISVIFAHFNRPAYLEKTLWSYYHLHKNLKEVEFIVVDDFSSKTAEEVCKKLSPKMNIVYYERTGEKRQGAGIFAFNKAAELASGDIIIIANPECMPISPILEEASYKLEKNIYLTFKCYSLSSDTQEKINLLDFSKSNVFNQMREFLVFSPSCVTTEGQDGWYNHPQFRPKFYHFTAGLRRKTYIEMGGFDELFGDGVAFEDDDFIRRLRLQNIPFVFADGTVLHQNHYKDSWAVSDMSLVARNQTLFIQQQAKKNWKAEQSLLYKENLL